MVDFTDIKKRAAGLKDKAGTYLDDHRDQIDKGLDKAGDTIGRKTGKQAQVGKAVGRAKSFLDRQAKP